jgi:hypothetical protein
METPETTALAEVKPKMTSPLAEIQKLEGFEDAILTPANMVLIQKTTRDPEATPGTFKDTITGQSYKEIQIVPLKIQVGDAQGQGAPRVMFAPDAAFGSDPICRSNDGVKPALNAAHPQSEYCKDCKWSSWKDYKTTKKPPACHSKARILFVERSTGLPFLINLGGRSITPVRNLLKSIMRFAAMSLMKGVRAMLYDFSCTMYLKDVVDSKGAYFVCQFKDISRVRDVGEFGPIYHELVKARDVMREVEAPASEDEVLDSTPTQGGTTPIVDAEVVDPDIPF